MQRKPTKEFLQPKSGRKKDGRSKRLWSNRRIFREPSTTVLTLIEIRECFKGIKGFLIVPRKWLVSIS